MGGNVSPALLRYRPCGIERTAMLLADLARSFRKDRLVRSLNAADDTPSTQRLGYLLERHGASRSADVVKAWQVGHHPRKVDLEGWRSFPLGGRHCLAHQGDFKLGGSTVIPQSDIIEAFCNCHH
jgi:hypothetical protein